jgi:hypothetical protein
MSKSRIEELEELIEQAHRERELAEAEGMEDEAYQWRQEASHLARELADERIQRPFTAYENEFGDYPI